MFDNKAMEKTKNFSCRYLSPLSAGPWTIHGACISARTETSYLVTADSQIVRLLIEKPQEWAVAFEVVQRAGIVVRVRTEGYDVGPNTYGANGVQIRYLRWLDGL